MSSPHPVFLQRPDSLSSLRTRDDSRYESVNSSQSLVEKFSLSPDPSLWTSDRPEADDDLHRPDPNRDILNDSGSMFTGRALVNLGCLFLLFLGILALFAGYPIVSHFSRKPLSTNNGFNVGGVNASGMVPSMPGGRGLIDPDTPQEAYTKASPNDGTQLKLVFSDEFNVDGRTFYPGDDPYWEAVDLHYWQTGNLEWYDPASITTKGGALKITLSAKPSHGLDYQGGMMSSWNKFCFTGGYIEASVTLPGPNNIQGLWPAIWTMGNLGRAGYGASLDGLWPYTYDACDIGTVANQSVNGYPDVSMYTNDIYHDHYFSFQLGQRLSRCTCKGESHPGPVHSDGTYVGRSSPEIDIFEALMIGGDPNHGAVSQSSQWAPFNANYEWFNTSGNYVNYNSDISQYNGYTGGIYQQAVSYITNTDQGCYELSDQCFSIYGYEYKPGYKEDNSFITWVSNDTAAWTLKGAGMDPDPLVNISARPIPNEPMYILLNLGMSSNFGYVDLKHLTFPATMSVDYIRVYQDPSRINYGCDPDDFPTQAYINEYIEAYTNPNLTTWAGDYQQPVPKNSFLGQC